MADADDMGLRLDYRALFGLLPEPYIIIRANSPTFTILDVSKGYAHLMMVRHEDVLGRSLFDVFPEQLFASMSMDHEQMRQGFEHVVERREPSTLGTIRYDRKVPDSGGLTVECYWRPMLFPIPDDTGEVRAILMRVDDVTDAFVASRNEALGSLDDESDPSAVDRVHRQYLQLLMQAPMALGLMEGKDLRISLSNPANDRLSPRPLPQGCRLREIYPEAELEPFFALIDRVFDTGEAFHATNTHLPVPGHKKPVYLTFALLPVRDHRGEILGVASFGFDVTEQMEMRQALERESERKDELLAMLSHELRSPLTPIAHANDLLRLNAQHCDPAQISDATAIIDRQLRQLRRQVDDLLDIARITRGDIAIVEEDLPISEFLCGALETCRHAIETRHQILKIHGSGEDLLLRADRARLIQITANLLDNASKYTPEGGSIEIELQCEPGEPGLLTLWVRDDGEGIEPGRLTEIFDLFTQGATTIARSRGGLGLGLTLVRRLVERLGGTVEARSEGPGTGSEFIVRLPVSAARQTPEESCEEPLDGLAGSRVLIIEDHRIIGETLASLLRNQGAQAYVATSGAQGLELARNLDLTHVLIDIGLPDISGYEVARLLREQTKHDACCLIAFTGYGQPEDVQAAMAAGFDHHLVKPASFKELFVILKH
jgi:signal transduction histidine kinase